jgi:hypothetical protein
LNDGCGKRPFGYGRYSPWIRDVNGTEEARLGCDSIDVKNVRVYSRAIKVTEMIGNYRFGI